MPFSRKHLGNVGGFEVLGREVVSLLLSTSSFGRRRRASDSADSDARTLRCRILLGTTKCIPFKRLLFPH
jgi:hypothetical protein